MAEFSIDLLGRSGPNDLLVELSPAEVRERLEMSLVLESTESWFESVTSTNRRYTGRVFGAKFEIRPLWRNRRFRPTLTGTIEEVENGLTRIRFAIQMDSLVLLPLLMPLMILIPIAVLLLTVGDAPLTSLPFWCIAPIMVFAIGTINTLFARYESKELLTFFVERFRLERVE